MCSVHGDDLTTTGPKEQLNWLKAELGKHYELTEAHRLGPAPTDDKEARVLNRIVRWIEDGLEYEADPRHAGLIIRTLNLAESRAVTTAGEDEKEWKLEEEAELLESAQAKE